MTRKLQFPALPRDASTLVGAIVALARRGTMLRWVSRLLIVASLVLSVVGFTWLRQAETQARRDDLELASAERSAILQRQVERVQDQLVSLEAFFGSSVEVTRAEFESFTRPILSQHPEIQALEWAEVVTAPERDAFEARLAEVAGVGAQISERSIEGLLQRAGERPQLVPIIFVEPFHGNEAALGFDLASEKARAGALERASRTDQPTSTGPVRLVQDDDGTLAVLIVMAHVKQRQLRGYLVGVYRVDEILRQALAGYPDIHLQFALQGPTDVGDGVLAWFPALRDSHEASESLIESARSTGRASVREIHVGGQSWRLATIATPEFIAEGRTWAPWLALVLGLLTTALVAGYTLLSVRHAQALASAAAHDALTGLLNRRGLEQGLETARESLPLAALLVNFDDFSGLNRAYGHGVGDVVLAELATRVKHAADRHCVVGRIGGDEMLVLAPSTDLAAASQLAERMRRRISALPVLAMPRSVHVTASIGVALLTETPPSLLQIIAEARTGLRSSKAQGKNRTSFGPDVAALDEAQAKDALRVICRDGDLRVIWEPLVRLSDEKVTGHELLVRGPVGEFERPGELFRAATEQGLLTLLDMRCLRACVMAAAARPAIGDLHINLLPSTLLDVPVSTILRLLEGLPAGARACIEVNEQQFVSHPSYLLESIRALREAGIRIAIDDVGSGRGTLDSVLVLQPDVVKIDVSLVRGASEDPTRSVQLGRLARLCQSLDIEMVAEGVETAADRDFVRALGIGTGQGYFWTSVPFSK